VLGLGSSLVKGGKVGRTYVKDGLKLYMPYKGSDASEVKFVGTGSTSFDGSNDYVDCGNDSSLALTGAFTISAWFKLDSVTDGQTAVVLSKGDTGSDRAVTFSAFRLDSEGGIKFSLFLSSDGSAWDLSTLTTGYGTISTGTWHNVVGTWNGSTTGNIYLDGVLKDTATVSSFTTTTTSSNVRIGLQSNDGGDFNGSIKNVSIWSRSLTSTEIQNVMYRSYAEVSGRLTDGLVSWWALDAAGLGSELITNGTFDDASTTGWELASDGSEVVNLFTISASGNGCNVSTDPNADHKYFGTADDGSAQGYGFSIINDRTYQISFDYTQNSGISPRIRIRKNSLDGGNIADFEVAEGAYTNTTVETKTSTFTAGDYSGGTPANIGYLSFDLGASTATNFTIDNVSLKEVLVKDLKGSNDGSIYGATVDEDLYGGDTPVIPRAIDNARTVQADAIGAGSAYFDTSNTDYIDCGVIDFDTNDFSMVAWYNADSLVDYSGIVTNRESSGTYIGSQIRVRGADIELITDCGGISFETKTVAFVPIINRWTHVAATVDRDGLQSLYIDGTLQATTDISGQSSVDLTHTDSLMIGKYIADNRYFDGNICQVGIWSKALTQAQIQSVMEKTYEELTASEKTNLVSYWALDETIESSGTGASFVYDKVDTSLGSELLTNGDFSDTTSTDSSSSALAGWTNEYTHNSNSKFTISGGACTLISDGTSTSMKQAILTVGKVYKVTVNITDVTSGGIKIYTGSSTLPTNITTTGIHTIYKTAEDSDLEVWRKSGVTSNVTFDDIVVKEVQGNVGQLI